MIAALESWRAGLFHRRHLVRNTAATGSHSHEKLAVLIEAMPGRHLPTALLSQAASPSLC
jgi:hypothetical protein